MEKCRSPRESVDWNKESRMALACIVFDCDGVLLESVDAKTKAFARLAEPFGPQAAAALVAHHTLHGGVSRYEKFAWFFSQVLGREITAEENRDWGERFTRYALDEVYNCPTVPGAMDVLELWKGKVPLYVASGTPSQELAEVLAGRGLAPYFDGIFGSPPAKAALLDNIVRGTQAGAVDTVMVGDSKTDMDAALIVGTKFYGRGKYFAAFHHPWHDDLTQLNAYLQSLV
jgi:phosphoglycolate phosphatase-like HAD superfamily hydrolase